jgi:ABC-type uncharacterized transport system substrate-binding protein
MGSPIMRRHFVLGSGAMGLGLLAGCGRLPWQAEQPARAYRLGYLRLAPPAGPSVQWTEAFLDALRDYGYVEGQNLLVEYRDAAGRLDLFPALAAELVALPVDVIYAGEGPAAALAAKQATSTIPIVVPVGDLLGNGLVASLARPGGNVTGLTNFSAQLVGKRLELLQQAVPGISRVAAIWNPANPAMPPYLQQTQDAAGELGLTLQPLAVRDATDLEPAFTTARQGADAVLVLTDAVLAPQAARIAELALQSRLPSMFQEREFAQVGGLMAYAPNSVLVYRRAAYYVDRILKGAKPADLPVEQPMTFDFVVNLKTARELGLTFPNEIMLQVTEVIQ